MKKIGGGGVLQNWGGKKKILVGGVSKKITSRTTGAKGNKFLRVITSFSEEASCSIYR